MLIAKQANSTAIVPKMNRNCVGYVCFMYGQMNKIKFTDDDSKGSIIS